MDEQNQVVAEDISGTSLPRICLNMIVKDEAHIIRETLDAVLPYIDYWVVSDTGSTDGTQELIREYFEQHHIDGELYQDDWVDFSTNRNLALKHCEGKCEYVLVFDADDTIQGSLPISETLSTDAYNLLIGPDVLYHRKALLKMTSGWYYKGVLHEYVVTDKPDPQVVDLNGDYCIVSRRLGTRSKDPLKYLKDAQLLEAALVKEPTNERYIFYCAQSYFDYKEYAKAAVYYQRRIDVGGWLEERYYSYLRLGHCWERLNKPDSDVVAAYQKGADLHPQRGETLYHLGIFYLSKGQPELAIPHLTQVVSLAMPDRALFVSKDIYSHVAGITLIDALCKTSRWLLAGQTVNRLLSRILPKEAKSKLEQVRKDILAMLFSRPPPIQKKWTKIIRKSESGSKPSRKLRLKMLQAPSPRVILAVGEPDTQIKNFSSFCGPDQYMVEHLVTVGVKVPEHEFVPDWNGLVEYSRKNNLEYLVWMPADWRLTSPTEYLRSSLYCLSLQPKCGAVLFNQQGLSSFDRPAIGEPTITWCNGCPLVPVSSHPAEPFPGMYRVSALQLLNAKSSHPWKEYQIRYGYAGWTTMSLSRINAIRLQR